MRRFVGGMERWQVPLYLAAIAIGAGIGLIAPGVAPLLRSSITPILGLLLFATFLGVPFARIRGALRDLRFLGTVVVVNFLVVPLVVFGLSRFVADDRGLLIGALLALLTPCVDYVIVFTGLAGGARDRLLAAAPMLMLMQILLLPVYLVLFAGAATTALIEPAPFATAFIVLIALPLVLAATVQWLARDRTPARVVETTMQGLMVPLMMLTLAVVVASQIADVEPRIGTLLRLVPLYAAFLLIMLGIGILAGRLVGLDVPAARALVFSGATRNSLVVLPIALALPPDLGFAAPAVVTQTLVELIGMVVFVWAVPRLVRARSS